MSDPVKTYVPGLVKTLTKTNRYGTRYNPQLNAALTTDQYTCLQASLVAIQSCLAAIGKLPKGE